MNDPFVFAIPGMMPTRAVNRPQQVEVLEDGSAVLEVTDGSLEDALPNVEFVVIDLSGRIRYHTTGSVDLFFDTVPGSPQRLRIVQRFPKCTFPITPCRILMRGQLGERLWLSGSVGMARTLAARSEDERIG